MATEGILQQYINRCNSVIEAGDSVAAEELVTEILAVFSDEYVGLKSQLTRYGFISAVSKGSYTAIVGDDQDDLKDLRLLKARLSLEIDKEKERNAMAKSQNTINIQGNATNVQPQQGTINSSQSQQVQSGIDFEEAGNIIEKIYSYQAMFTQEFGAKAQDFEQALEEAKSAVQEKEPTRLKKTWNTIKSLAEGATGSLIATGIVELLKTVPLMI